MTVPRVLVFLGAYQGADFIAEQITSILHQSVRCDLIVSDDGSCDGSRHCVAEIASRSQSLSLIEGPRQGFCANFLSVFHLADVDRYDYVAWSDQDDVWERHHLERAITVLRSYQGPAAFGSRTQLIDESGRVIGYSPAWKRPLSFQNALVQSVMGGNTLVMNRKCVQWVQQCMANGPAVAEHWVSHDWAVYLMLSLAEFPVIWDAEPTVRYRQHATNVVGANRSVAARLHRLKRMQSGVFAEWLRRHFTALQLVTDAMPVAHRDALHWLINATHSGGMQSLRALNRSGVYRQSGLDQRALQSAAVLGCLMPKSTRHN